MYTLFIRHASANFSNPFKTVTYVRQKQINSIVDDHFGSITTYKLVTYTVANETHNVTYYTYHLPIKCRACPIMMRTHTKDHN